MGNGERIKSAIEAGLRDRYEPRRPRSDVGRAPKKAKVPELDLGDAGSVGGGLHDPLGRLTPLLIEQGLALLEEAGPDVLEQVGALLRGLERFDVRESTWDGVVAELFEAAVTGLLRCPELPEGGADFVQLSEAVVAGVATELKTRLTGDTPPALDEGAQRRLGSVLVSLLHHAGRALGSSPSLRTMAAERRHDLAQQLSGSVCGVCLMGGDGARWAAVLTEPPTLDRLVRGLWGLIADFPGAFSEPAAILWWRDVLAELARPRRDESVCEPDLVAEAVVLVVERGAVDFPALVRNPSNKQLFLTTMMRGLLEVMTEPIGEEAKFRMIDRFGRSELNVVMEATVGAWIERPEWLFRKPAQQEKAATLLPVLVEALAHLDEGSLKALLRHDRLQRVLVSALLSGLSSKLSSLSGRRIASVLIPVLTEVVAIGFSGWGILLEQDRLTDLLTAISKSKIEEKLFGEDPEDVRAAARSIAVAAQELRSGRCMPLSELVERLNKGK